MVEFVQNSWKRFRNAESWQILLVIEEFEMDETAELQLDWDAIS